MSAIKSPIDSLPNELLIAVLSTIESRELLPLTLVDRRFDATATTILQHRLLHTVKMEGHDMVLESYHPVAKQSTPTMTCRFLGLSFPNHTRTGEQDMDLRDLSQLYSHFRPVVSEETRRMWRVFGRRLPGAPIKQEVGDEPVTQELILDDGELFSQLCTTTSLIKSGSIPSLLSSYSNITHGVVRVWRNWLAEAAASSAICPAGRSNDQNTILWTDAARTVGLKLRVTEVTLERLPPYHGLDEDPPVAYSLHYEELLVRTNHLLLALEKSALQDVAILGRATIIAPI
ncbi:F-box domain-containing protein [Colletotrichum tabaci]|uniref:F-box domain-containing protein n=1 Tax=Colletotrichum tabaci TaxID=1209068 RepID=A0AAV9TK25_9PEZI